MCAPHLSSKGVSAISESAEDLGCETPYAASSIQPRLQTVAPGVTMLHSKWVRCLHQATAYLYGNKQAKLQVGPLAALWEHWSHWTQSIERLSGAPGERELYWELYEELFNDKSFV